MLIQPQTREEFYNRYHTEKTQLQAKVSLKAFEDYLLDHDMIEQELFTSLKKDDDQRYLFLDNLVQYWHSTNKSANTIHNYFSFVRAWLWINGVKTNQYEIKFVVIFPKTIREVRKPLTYEIIRNMLNRCDAKYKALYLILASSGMRIGEVLALRKQDLEYKNNPIRVHVRAETTKTKQERQTYISQEAFEVLRPIIQEKKDDELIFDMKYVTVANQISKLRQRCGYLEKYSNGKNYYVNIHALRAFFHTQATLKHGVETAHALLGHGTYLNQYFRLTEENRDKMYKELEPLVSIYVSDRTRVKIEQMKKQVEDMDLMKKKFAVIEAKLARIELTKKEI